MFRYAVLKKPGRSVIKGITSHPELGPPDYETALQQHEACITALCQCGLEVFTLESEEQFPDSCFIEDTAICTQNMAVITRLGTESRQGEELSVAKALHQYYDQIHHIRPPGTLEGGDVMMVGDHHYIGLSKRTNRQGAQQLIELLKRYGLSGSMVEMQDMLHLKTGIAYLENGLLLAAGEFIQHPSFQDYKKIIIPESETYAANAIWINDFVVVAEGYPETAMKIREQGYKVLTVDTSEFRKLDGGLSCLSLRF